MRQTLLNIGRFLYQLFFCHKKNTYQDGISVLVCVKDEEYNIKLCIDSVIPFADQIICVDHNSSDSTYEIMQGCQNKYKNSCEFIVTRCTSMHLKDARNKGLQYVNRKFVLNSGGDFIFYTEGIYDFKKIFSRLKGKKYNFAVRFGFVNLYGDLHHTYKEGDVYSLGENYLFSMSNKLYFKETGKFDYMYFPQYYVRKKIDSPIFFHMSGLKSDERLIYRNCYFEWKEVLNNESKKELKDFKLFAELWKKKIFGTTQNESLKFRFQRQLAALYYRAYNENEYFEYPSVIKDLINKGNERFKVIYKDGKAYLRHDMKDNDMHNYVPTQDDLLWSIELYDRKYHEKKYLEEIKHEILKI